MAAEVRALNPGFFKRMESGMPWVRVKLGATLDGRTALRNGASRWITGETARRDAQRYRARSSVVLTGVGTVLADDPAMNARGQGITRQPLRVLLDSDLRAPPTARMFRREGHVLVFTAAEGVTAEHAARQPALAALAALGVRVESMPRAPQGGLDLQRVLRRLAELEANEIWVEAGPTLAGAFLAGGWVDELVVYMAPSLLGPGMPLAHLPPLESLEQRLRLQFVECTAIGTDLRIIARPAPMDDARL
jgi:diaminohydroxyphosphoribosylaminopyrimidine deaminase/5-amino-6-(5-phosphoribosylamino)uracil reductase